jgi:hypothetical protein
VRSWLAAVVLLVGCKQWHDPHRELEPEVIPEAKGASRMRGSPDGTRLEVERCADACAVETIDLASRESLGTVPGTLDTPSAYVVEGDPPVLRAASWQVQLTDVDARGARLTFTGDGRALVVTQYQTYDGYLEPRAIDVVNLETGRYIARDLSHPSQIADVATFGPRSVVFAEIRHPHAHSGGYDRPTGITVYDVDTWQATRWQAPYDDENAPLWSAVAVTTDGHVLAALED